MTLILRRDRNRIELVKGWKYAGTHNYWVTIYKASQILLFYKYNFYYTYVN